MAVGHWSGCHPVLEQPSGSDMPKCEPLKSVLACVGAIKHVCWLGSFGGESPKPLQIWSSKDLSQLQRGRPKASHLHKLCTSKGKSYTGRHSALKLSQAYPQLHCTLTMFFSNYDFFPDPGLDKTSPVFRLYPIAESRGVMQLKSLEFGWVVMANPVHDSSLVCIPRL